MLQAIQIVLFPFSTSAQVKLMQVSTVYGVINSDVSNYTSELLAYNLIFQKL